MLFLLTSKTDLMINVNFNFIYFLILNCFTVLSIYASNNEIILTNMDSHTLSNYHEVQVSHAHLDLAVDFSNKILTGSATLSFSRISESNQLILDTKYLVVKEVLDQFGNNLKFKFLEKDELLGIPLSVQLNDSTQSVKIFYATTEKSEALDWLSAEQTAGKEFPFMYTQGQSIFTRSWIPIQDTPGIRVTYDAEITVPDGMLPVMSASNPQEYNSSNTYHFEMKQSIPPYLIALAVGNLAFKAIDDRTGVYAEPSMLPSCADELIDMGKMVDAAEELYGEYDWERFDVIVLPPSFPFGGMENPRLTFATPTIIAGDKSLTALIAHELAHSWSGNLVTNATWDDFWLNEGFTVYFERRIMEALYGKDYVEMLALLGFQSLERDLKALDSNLQRLKLKLKGLHPDEGMSEIAYEKGYFFLRLIEETVGRDKFDVFLKNYFNDHKFQTIITEYFIGYLKDNLLIPSGSKINIDEWVYSAGLPENCPVISCSRFEAIDSLLNLYQRKSDVAILDAKNWSTHEWRHFIAGLHSETSKQQMKSIDEKFNLTQSGNSEILAIWFEQSIRFGYEGIDAALEQFLIRIGRRKFLVPLYQALTNTISGKKRAREIYEKARSNYHYVSYSTIDKILE